jgi:hypothetical protein
MADRTKRKTGRDWNKESGIFSSKKQPPSEQNYLFLPVLEIAMKFGSLK